MFHVLLLPYVLFVTFEGGQATLPLLHLQPHRGELFLGTPPLGLGLSGVLWNATMRKRVHGCVFACVCVWREEDYGREGKWGFAEWQLNGELKDTEGEAIFPESGRKKKKKEENVGGLMPSAKTTEERLTHLWSESRVTSLLLWDTLEVSVRSINTSVLTFPPDFLH